MNKRRTRFSNTASLLTKKNNRPDGTGFYLKGVVVWFYFDTL